MTNFKRFLTLFFVTIFAVSVWGVEYSEITTITSGSVVSGSSYQAHTYSASDVDGDTIDWVITFGGNNISVGTNSSKRSSCNLGNYTKYAVSPITSSQVASAFVSTTAISNVSKISYTFNGGSNQTNTNVYLIYSSNGTSFSQLSLTSGTQGAAISSGTNYVFTKCSGYFGLLFVATNSSGNWRIDNVSISLYAESSSDPSITPSVTELDWGTVATGASLSTKTFTITGSNLTAADLVYTANGGYAVSPSGKTGAAGTLSSQTITVTPPSTAVAGTYNSTVSISGGGLASPVAINVKLTVQDPCAIRFYNNGTQVGATQNLLSGEVAVKPDDPDPCDAGYTFVGWWTAELDEDNTTAHTWVTDFTVSGAQDYYAVFSKAGDGGGSATFDFAAIATAESWEHDTKNHSPLIIGDVTLSVTGGSYSGRWYSGTYRVYSGETITITSSAGGVTSVSSNPSRTFTVSGGEATFSPSSGTNFTSIEVNYGTTYYTTDCGSSCSTPTLTWSNGGATENKYVGDANFTITATPSSNPLGGTVTYSSSLPSKASVDPATGEVTIHDAMSTTPVVITATLGKETSGSDCQKQVKASYTLNIYNKVTWLVNGAEYTTGGPTTATVEGGTIDAYPTDPDGSSICGGKTFVGWTDAPYVESSSAPTNLYKDLSDFPNITANATYHAVFAEEIVSSTSSTYDLVRNPSEFVSGEDYVIAAYSGGNDYALKAAMSGSYNLASQSVSIPTSNTFTCTDALLIWQVTKKAENQYTLYNASAGKYAYMYTSGTYKNLGLQDDEYIWDLQYEKEDDYSPTYYFEAGNISDYYFYYNSSAFKTTSTYPTNIYFYKKATEYTYDAYSTTCGPVIKAYEVERLTSTKDQTVKSQAITVRGSSLAGGTLTPSITGTNAGYFSCTLASNAIVTGAINTTYTISYTPDAFGDVQHTATLTFTDGTTTSDPITLHGRSLPEHFAIVAQVGANYYALDGSMTGEMDRVPPFPVTVTAGAVDLCPSQAVYTLTDRDPQDEKVHLVGPAGRLWGSSSKSSLNTKSLTSTSQTGWLLSTTNFSTYHITNADATDRGIIYYESSDAFGHYKTTNYGAAHYFGDLMLLPITNVCTCLPKPFPTPVARATSATITWGEIAGADHYEVTCSAGSVTVVGTRATITGLGNNTTYTYTVKAVATGYDCSLVYNGSFTTVDCDDVPYDIVVTPAVKKATVKWQMEAATATLRVYSDENCTVQVGSDFTGKTSPATVDGLTENTQYYLKIFAGPYETCASAAVPFLTQTTAVELVEWATDHINIVLTADDASASVLIEDKNENSSSVTTYATDIFFSKYYEAAGYTKLVGLYNGTDHDIDISDLIIKGGKTSWSSTKSDHNYVVLADVTKLNNDYGDGGGHILLPRGTEIILYSLDKDNSSTGSHPFPGAGCLDQFYDWDDLADNSVANWYRIGTLEAGSDADGHTTLNFSGPYSIGLFRGSSLIDIIGAGNASAPTDATTVSYSKTNGDDARTLGNGRTINQPNDQYGFWYEDGWSPKPQESDPDYSTYPDGYSTYLSTNRCLLIRANHVLAGDSAVMNNTLDFVTLGTYTGPDSKEHKSEWVGIPVGKNSNSTVDYCFSGQQFGYVGSYDYNDYYAKYEEVTTVDELWSKKNEDGTYSIPIPQLDTLSCTMMRVKVYEGGVEKASREYKVPIMIDATTVTTADDAYFHSYARKDNSATVCRECDVVILRDAVLTKASSSDPKDIHEVRNLTIYPGGTLIIPSGVDHNFTVKNVQFRVEGENVPHAKLQGTLRTNDQQVIVSRRINNSDAYFFSLPYDCNLSDVRWSNGEPAMLGEGWKLQEYDAAARAAEGSTAGAPGHWKDITGPTIETKKGYQIMVNSKYLKELVFPMNIGTNNVSDAENIKINNTDRVDIVKNEGTTTPNNWNWNFIAEPYLCAMSPMEGATIKAGWLLYHEGTTEDPGYWTYEDGSNVYFTVYNPSTKTYDQKKFNTLSQLDPFVAYFVQGKTAGQFEFTQSHRILNTPRRMPTDEELQPDASIFVGVTLSGNGQSDETSVRLRPDFTNEYQPGYDLQKFTTYYTERPQIYMKTPDYQLAFQAVSDSVAKSTWLPMGVYIRDAGTYTFALDANCPTDEVEAVYLYDATTGATTNLLYDTYSVATSKQLYTNKRFSLNVILNRKQPQVPTGVDLTDAPENMVRKLLIDGHVYIQRGNALYDVTGKQMLNR